MHSRMCLYARGWSLLGLGSLSILSKGRGSHVLRLLRRWNLQWKHEGLNTIFYYKNRLSSRQYLSLEPHPSSWRRTRCARYAWWLRCCTHAMNSSTPSIVYVRKGKTTSHSVRSCDTVRAGAFFPHV